MPKDILDSKQSFIKHIVELRKRVIFVVSFYIITAIISYIFYDMIYEIVASPLTSSDNESIRFIYTNLTEAFISQLELSTKFALLLSIPVMSFQIYKFIEPGLLKREKMIMVSAIIASNILFFIGAVFVYFAVMPKAFQFFLSFEQSKTHHSLVLQAKISEYISLFSNLVLSFGIAFQLPVILLAGVYGNVLKVDDLSQYRRLAIVAIFIIAAIITPPDVLSQLLLAFPLIFLYELTIIIAKKIERKK